MHNLCIAQKPIKSDNGSEERKGGWKESRRKRLNAIDERKFERKKFGIRWLWRKILNKKRTNSERKWRTLKGKKFLFMSEQVVECICAQVMWWLMSIIIIICSSPSVLVQVMAEERYSRWAQKTRPRARERRKKTRKAEKWRKKTEKDFESKSTLEEKVVSIKDEYEILIMNCWAKAIHHGDISKCHIIKEKTIRVRVYI